MTPELLREIKRYQQWFGSYRKSGELVKVHVWLTIRDGFIEFLTGADSYKAKRVLRTPRVICFIGRENGAPLPGTAEMVNDQAAMDRVYRAYWKSHPILMLWFGLPIKKRIRSGRQIVVRVTPDDPNPLTGVTDPVL